jgi:hypothetical protein
MRMRKLGKGQSVVFYIPEEVQKKIEKRKSKTYNGEIEVADVLSWTISETLADLRHSMPLWATQGCRYEDHKHLLNGSQTSIHQARRFLEDEAQTIDRRYRPRPQALPSAPQLDSWDTTNESIAQIIARCHDFDTMDFDSATLQEEQERELSPEIEQERQIERPAPMEAEAHRIDDDLVCLVRTGRFPQAPRNFLPAFRALSSCSAASLMDLAQFPTELLVTADFMHTVKRPHGLSSAPYCSDSFQRPIQWVLSVVDPRRLVVVSPFEANELLLDISQSKWVTLHIYSPRLNIGYHPLDALDLYTIGHKVASEVVPRSLVIQLNLFAGQLYLRSFNEYVELCDHLGLNWKATEDGEVVRADGFIVPAVGKWGLKDSPVNFLRVLLTKVRRNCEGIEKTHIGKILIGMLLERNDLE